jgi:hypothetical protein
VRSSWQGINHGFGGPTCVRLTGRRFPCNRPCTRAQKRRIRQVLK